MTKRRASLNVEARSKYNNTMFGLRSCVSPPAQSKRRPGLGRWNDPLNEASQLQPNFESVSPGLSATGTTWRLPLVGQPILTLVPGIPILTRQRRSLPNERTATSKLPDKNRRRGSLHGGYRCEISMNQPTWQVSKRGIAAGVSTLNAMWDRNFQGKDVCHSPCPSSIQPGGLLNIKSIMPAYYTKGTRAGEPLSLYKAPLPQITDPHKSVLQSNLAATGPIGSMSRRCIADPRKIAFSGTPGTLVAAKQVTAPLTFPADCELGKGPKCPELLLATSLALHALTKDERESTDAGCAFDPAMLRDGRNGARQWAIRSSAC